MRHVVRMFAAVCLISGAAAAFAAGGKQSTVVIEGEYPALAAYDKGFALGVMRDTNGVRLFDRVLVQDDGPGAGFFGKGIVPSAQCMARRRHGSTLLEDVRAAARGLHPRADGKSNLRWQSTARNLWDPKSTTTRKLPVALLRSLVAPQGIQYQRFSLP